MDEDEDTQLFVNEIRQALTEQINDSKRGADPEKA